MTIVNSQSWSNFFFRRKATNVLWCISLRSELSSGSCCSEVYGAGNVVMLENDDERWFSTRGIAFNCCLIIMMREYENLLELKGGFFLDAFQSSHRSRSSAAFSVKGNKVWEWKFKSVTRVFEGGNMCRLLPKIPIRRQMQKRSLSTGCH